ncbi:hypothetical protein ACFQZC_06045 [Streptacidiphilus monticola]
MATGIVSVGLHLTGPEPLSSRCSRAARPCGCCWPPPSRSPSCATARRGPSGPPRHPRSPRSPRPASWARASR